MASASSANDVEAEGRLYDGTGFPYTKRKRSILETLDHLAAAEATEVASCLRRTAIRMLTSEGGEVAAIVKLLRNVRDLRSGFVFAARCGGALRASVHE